MADTGSIIAGRSECVASVEGEMKVRLWACAKVEQGSGAAVMARQV